MTVQAYNVGEVNLLIANSFPIDDWISLTREDVADAKFTLEQGILGEVFTDIVGSDRAVITIVVLQTSTLVKTFTDIYNLQRIGFLGVPLSFTSQVEASFYPMCILEGRPKKVDSKDGEAVSYRILAGTQFNTALQAVIGQ